MLMVPFVLQTVSTVALIGYLSTHNRQAAATNLANPTLLFCVFTLLGSIGLSWLTAKRIIKPIAQLDQASRALAEGLWQKPLSEKTPIAELKNLIHSFNRTAAQFRQSFDRVKTGLEQSEARFQKLGDASPAVIYTVVEDPTQGITQFEYLSPAAEEIHELPIAKLMQDGSLVTAQIHPDDRGGYLQAVVASLETMQPFTYEWRIITPSGRIKWLQAHSRPEHWETGKTAWHGIVIEVTERKRVEAERRQAELALKQTLQELQSHIDNSPLATVRWSPDFRVEYWSKQAEHIFGWSAAEVLGKTFHEWRFVYEEDLAYVTQKADGVHPDADRITINRNYCKDGSIVFCEWYNSILFDEAGNAVSTLSLVQDITERKRAEQELQQTKEAAEAANQAKSTFLANMSHELRSPLHTILGFTQLIQRDRALSATHQKHLQLIYNSGNHLLKLINEILDLAKIEAGRLSLQNQQFNPFELLSSLEAMFSPQAASRGLTFRLNVLPSVPRSIIADSQKLQQVLINLIGNAIKFTAQGRITLSVSAIQDVEQGAATAGRGLSALAEQISSNPLAVMLCFQVEDTGVGIASQDLDLIFDAFAQAPAGQALQEGTGLGLTISRKLVELMGGQITVNSRLEQGSTFQFTLPVQIADPAPRLSPRQRIIGLAPHQPTYRILVVDDQADNRLLLVHLFRSLGLEVREASTGLEAIDLWKAWQPHLIWMDIRMPELNGDEATRQIRAAEQQAGNAPIIIALTAQAAEADRTLALTAGCNDYISKPFQEEMLLNTMKRYLGIQYVYG
ncbi:PAS domain S-box protein [Leptolyngbya ohadii]|uniref:PAS domain S-box protein n=1 Tax=Leptolyngbya ohadii TaxID=1962290 RepID=UPI001179C672|nr:PAS domain S-box protein [Leptolyngbya ohadii]